ncbi:unnamed protein product [Trichogramma brassicae]|uniref:Uncharacterized protein n=1 Tax=Trichogramma brassicae TaxID=86971 RepID=A0A6H5J931_9HYME|nr:unnamed protein product [Trichogramma brassicae]
MRHATCRNLSPASNVNLGKDARLVRRLLPGVRTARATMAFVIHSQIYFQMRPRYSNYASFARSCDWYGRRTRLCQPQVIDLNRWQRSRK